MIIRKIDRDHLLRSPTPSYWVSVAKPGLVDTTYGDTTPDSIIDSRDILALDSIGGTNDGTDVMFSSTSEGFKQQPQFC